jgi:hypothetical protein
MSEVAYPTREEAAMTCDVHVDTIRHDQRRKKYPNARPRPDGVIEIPVSDLVTAGRLDPLEANALHTEIVSKSRIERELLEPGAQLAVKFLCDLLRGNARSRRRGDQVLVRPPA